MAIAMAPKMDAHLFKRWGHDVEGWFNSPYELEEKPGIFVIATQGFQMPFVLDVGQSDNVRFTVLNHERRVFWRRNALGCLYYASIYTEHEESAFLNAFYRQNIEQHIRKMEQPVFGEHEMFAHYDQPV